MRRKNGRNLREGKGFRRRASISGKEDGAFCNDGAREEERPSNTACISTPSSHTRFCLRWKLARFNQ